MELDGVGVAQGTIFLLDEVPRPPGHELRLILRRGRFYRARDVAFRSTFLRLTVPVCFFACRTARLPVAGVVPVFRATFVPVYPISCDCLETRFRSVPLRFDFVAIGRQLNVTSVRGSLLGNTCDRSGPGRPIAVGRGRSALAR